MSSVSWAYPWENKDDGQSKQNGHDYTQWSATTDAEAEAKVQKYMDAAGVKAGDSALTITFTIAGSSITEHPTYAVFLNAQRILNNLGWNVEIKADSQALTKLSTGSLEVWAAAWGSTIDPDMYQVYHKYSQATSVNNWGYSTILSDVTGVYDTEKTLISTLSDLIDEGRSMLDQDLRAYVYSQALDTVMELAVELPTYQRRNLLVYNSSKIDPASLTPTSELTAYRGLIDKIWELDLL
jgi:peptide/nickel transport system substrate-binding protein